MMLVAIILGTVLTTAGAAGTSLTIKSEAPRIDPAKSLFLTITLTTPRGVTGVLPDLRDRAVGFSLAEDFLEGPVTHPDGSLTQAANWRLVPEPAAEVYKLRPMAIGEMLVPPTYFENPLPRDAVTGDFELTVKKDLPPFSWKLFGQLAGLVAPVVLLGYGIFALFRYLTRRIKEHRMSPIERAWVELDRLLKKGLPGRGKYKDFYVELTLVVRRYVQRKYGIAAPHLTTEEFLRARPDDRLGEFLIAADLIKFAGVQASPETADQAVESARAYLKGDSAV